MTTKNFVVKNGLTTGNIILDAVTSNITANVVVANLSVPASANLGSNANVKITGGTTGQYLQTDGTGNLSWATVSGGGGGSIAGSNTQVQFNNAGSFGASANFAFNNTSNTLTVDRAIHINGANLGSNVSNVYIGGGTSNQVLKTDGAGNLTWTTISAGTGVYVDTFSGNGVQTNFTISSTPANANLTLINYNGALQLHGAYTVTGNVVTMSEAPSNGSTLEVITLPIGGGGSGGSGGVAVGKTVALNMFLGF